MLAILLTKEIELDALDHDVHRFVLLDVQFADLVEHLLPPFLISIIDANHLLNQVDPGRLLHQLFWRILIHFFKSPLDGIIHRSLLLFFHFLFLSFILLHDYSQRSV